MGLIGEIPDGSHIALDASSISYFIEQHERFRPIVRPVFQSISSGLITAVVSVVTLLEVLVLPLRTGRSDLVAAYRELLAMSRGITLRTVDATLAEQAASVRGAYGVRTPDALVAATAVVEACTHLVTMPSEWRLPAARLGRHSKGKIYDTTGGLTNDPPFARVPSFQTLVISQFTDA